VAVDRQKRFMVTGRVPVRCSPADLRRTGDGAYGGATLRRRGRMAAIASGIRWSDPAGHGMQVVDGSGLPQGMPVMMGEA
jgi:hypothetical protein